MYFFKKKYTQCTMGSGADVEISRIFLLKVTLLSVRLLLTVSYRKNAPPSDAQTLQHQSEKQCYNKSFINYDDNDDDSLGRFRE